MRLIDADKIVYSWTIDNDGEEHDGVTLQSIINKMPTVDAVEVVRCKDCVGCDRDDGSPWCGLVGLHVDDDHYCAWGERREDADT